MLSDEEFKRIRWASRRGMLELDLIMVPFVEERLRDLSDQDQQRYIDLLEEEDNDLFAWLLGRGRPENEDQAIIVDMMIDHARRTEA
jgi:antitoxin CptB